MKKKEKQESLILKIVEVLESEIIGEDTDKGIIKGALESLKEGFFGKIYVGDGLRHVRIPAADLQSVHDGLVRSEEARRDFLQKLFG